MSGEHMKDFKSSLVPRRIVSMASFVWLVAGALFLFFASSSRAQRTVFSENFEGVFPGTNWLVSDASGAGAKWDDVNLGQPHLFGTPPPRPTGGWAGYCAGIGYAGTSSFPEYLPDMLAVMERTVDLTTATNATLRFWYTIPSIESF